jgi:acetolactate synthase regulatory subunit
MLAALESPSTTAGPAGVLRVSVLTTGSPDALVRILMLLRRRGCTLLSVEYSYGDQHRPGRLELALRTQPRTGHRVVAWLQQLVEVQRVEVE